MYLIKKITGFLSWLRSATMILMSVSTATTTKLVLAIIGGQISSVLSVLLPLKVILLVGSDGVPVYFSFFITPQTKSYWVAILAIATIALFGLAQYLEQVVNRNATKGAQYLRNSANQAPIGANEDELATTTYQRVTDTCAKITFSALSLVVGLLILPHLFIATIVIILFQLGLISRSIDPSSQGAVGRSGRYLREETNHAVKLLKTINFFSVFILLLLSFLFLPNVNRLAALASIIISRQLFNGLGDFALNATKLAGDRERIDALLFRESRFAGTSASRGAALSAYFSAPKRLNRVKQLTDVRSGAQSHQDFGHLCSLDRVTESLWIDPGGYCWAIFDLYGPGGTLDGNRLFREYVYDGNLRGLEQHDFLLQYLDCEALRCLRPVGQYTDGAFIGRIVEYGDLRPVAGRSWTLARQALLSHLWNLPIPDSLFSSFVAVHLQLHERIDDAFLDDLRLAADEDWAWSAYQRFGHMIPDMRDRVSRLPVFLLNYRLTPGNVLTTSSDEARLVAWNYWGLEPIGAGFQPGLDGASLLVTAAEAAFVRGSSYRCSLNDVFCSALLYRSAECLRQRRPKQALELLSRFLPLVDLSESDLLANLDKSACQGTVSHGTFGESTSTSLRGGGDCGPGNSSPLGGEANEDVDRDRNAQSFGVNPGEEDKGRRSERES